MTINATNYRKIGVRRRYHVIMMKRKRLVKLMQSLGGVSGAIADEGTYASLSEIIDDIRKLRLDLEKFYRGIVD